MTYNADDEVFRHHSSDIDLIEPSLDEPDTEFDFWAPISRHNWTEEADNGTQINTVAIWKK